MEKVQESKTSNVDKTLAADNDCNHGSLRNIEVQLVDKEVMNTKNGSLIMDNPFKSKGQFIPQELNDTPVQFSTFKYSLMQITPCTGKDLESMHKKMTEIFEVAVSEVKEKELADNDYDCMDTMINSQLALPRRRKALSQNIHPSSLPFSFKTNRGKKIRGDLKDKAWDHLRVLLKENKPNMVLLVETHLNEENSLICISKFGEQWAEILVVDTGRSEGIILVWKKNEIDVKKVFECKQCLNAVIYPKNGKPWMMTGIYASNCPSERLTLWNFLRRIDVNNLPWLLIGYFNCVDKAEDKKGGNSFKWSNSISAYRDLCIEAGLMDVRFQKSKFTWCNNRVGTERIWAMLDKALVNWEWINTFNRNYVQHLCKIASDHKPIMFVADNPSSGRRIVRDFIFEHYWFEHEGLEQFIKDNLYFSDAQGSKMVNIGQSLKTLEKKLTIWAKTNTGLLEKELDISKVELTKLEKYDEDGISSEQDICKIKCLANKIMALNRQVHIKWWSKAKINWMEENNKNTKFFHNLAKFKRSGNDITYIKMENVLIEHSTEIAKAFAKWYDCLWEADSMNICSPGWNSVKTLKWKRLSNSKRTSLCRDFLPEEIWKAVDSLGRGKSPGPYGYNVEFYIRFVIGDSFFKAMQEFQASSTIPSSWGEPSLIFIKKKENPGLHEVIQKLKEGLRIKVGLGTKIDVFNDPWLSNIPINRWPTYLNMDMLFSYKKVSQLICNGNWKKSDVLDLFGGYHLDSILRIHISKNCTKDKWIWSLDEKGMLNYKSAYNFIKENNTCVIDSEHNWEKYGV
ncbi:hypothetical protein Cni_G23586 [Canna indica]|uniref:Reverse transcriptase n=1 Tax=Canna indica TaxID=4628 RepID=A0AAQ3QNR5_9LILI|nr:hypothetical protein Cni_G23586 [Canna indica]